MAYRNISSCFPNTLGKYSNGKLFGTAATFDFELERSSKQFGLELELLEKRIAVLQTQLIALNIKRGNCECNSPFNKWTEYGMIKRELKLVNEQKKTLLHNMRESSRNRPTSMTSKWGSNPIFNGLPFVLDKSTAISTNPPLEMSHKNTKENISSSSNNKKDISSFESSNEDGEWDLNEVASLLDMDLVSGENIVTQNDRDEDILAIPMLVANENDGVFMANMNDEFDKLMNFLESDVTANVVPPSTLVVDQHEEASNPIVVDEADLIKINDLNCSLIATSVTAAENEEDTKIASSEESITILPHQGVVSPCLPLLVFEDAGRVKMNEPNCTFLEEKMPIISETDNLIHFGKAISFILSILVEDGRMFRKQPCEVPLIETPMGIPVDGDIETLEVEMNESYTRTFLAQYQSIVCV